MKTAKLYTVTQAVVDAIESLPWDVEWHCYDLFNKARANLIANNNPSKPYDGTLQRIMRRYRHVYHIECVNINKSIYVKKSDE